MASNSQIKAGMDWVRVAVGERWEAPENTFWRRIRLSWEHLTSLHSTTYFTWVGYEELIWNHLQSNANMRTILSLAEQSARLRPLCCGVY